MHNKDHQSDFLITHETLTPVLAMKLMKKPLSFKCPTTGWKRTRQSRAAQPVRLAIGSKNMEINDSIILVRECITKISDIFYRNSNIYFSESDLQSNLFALLLEKFDAKDELKTFVWGTDNPKKVKKVITRKLHSELLLPEGRIDLAVLDLEKTVFAVNSKGRNPGIRVEKGNHIFIEIKASRTNRSSITSKNRWYELILSDIEKLNRYTSQCFMLCFDYEHLLGENEISSIRDNANNNVDLHYIKSCHGSSYFY